MERDVLSKHRSDARRCPKAQPSVSVHTTVTAPAPAYPSANICPAWKFHNERPGPPTRIHTPSKRPQALSRRATFYQKPEFRKTERNVLMRSRHLDQPMSFPSRNGEIFRPRAPWCKTVGCGQVELSVMFVSLMASLRHLGRDE